MRSLVILNAMSHRKVCCYGIFEPERKEASSRRARKILLCKNEVNEEIHVQCSRKQSVFVSV